MPGEFGAAVSICGLTTDPRVTIFLKREAAVKRLRIRFGEEYFAALSAVWDGWEFEARAGRRAGK